MPWFRPRGATFGSSSGGLTPIGSCSTAVDRVRSPVCSSSTRTGSSGRRFCFRLKDRARWLSSSAPTGYGSRRPAGKPPLRCALASPLPHGYEESISSRLRSRCEPEVFVTLAPRRPGSRLLHRDSGCPKESSEPDDFASGRCDARAAVLGSWGRVIHTVHTLWRNVAHDSTRVCGAMTPWMTWPQALGQLGSATRIRSISTHVQSWHASVPMVSLGRQFRLQLAAPRGLALRRVTRQSGGRFGDGIVQH